MPEIGKAAKADDFSAKLWICSDSVSYTHLDVYKRQVVILRSMSLSNSSIGSMARRVSLFSVFPAMTLDLRNPEAMRRSRHSALPNTK